MDPGPLRDVLTLVLGLLTGAMSAAFGVGGAVISTPGVRLLGAPALVAVGTTLPSILPGAIAGTVRYMREGFVDRRVVAAVAPVGMVAAVGGSLASEAVPGEGRWLMVATALFVALTAARLAVGRGEADTAGEAGAAGQAGEAAEPPPRRSLGAVVAIGAGAGALSGLLGLGGGTILLPGFITFLRMPVKDAIATSLACVGLLAIPATVAHGLLGHIDWRLAALLALTVIPGARLGAAATVRASERRLRVVVAVVLGVIAAAYLVVELGAILRG